jgi:hypothetical protein
MKDRLTFEIEGLRLAAKSNECCGFAVLPLNNLTAVLQHGITAALCLTAYLGLLGSRYVTSYGLRVPG